MTTKPLIVVVTGTRRHSRELARAVVKALNSLKSSGRPMVVFQGECAFGGADAIAKTWCAMKNVACVGFTPSIHTDASALKIRNTLMAESAKALELSGEYEAIMLAFPDSKSVGTWDAVNRAKRVDLNVDVVKFEDPA